MFHGLDKVGQTLTAKSAFGQLLVINSEHNGPTATIIAVILALVALPLFTPFLGLQLSSRVPFGIGPGKLHGDGAQSVMIFRFGIQKAAEIVQAAVGQGLALYHGTINGIARSIYHHGVRILALSLVT